MENEIKKLVEKWKLFKEEEKDAHDIGGEFHNAFSLINTAIDDFQSLLEFKKRNCCGKPAENGINKAYERFKHLDVLLSDPFALYEDQDPIYSTCYDLWKVIKEEAIKNG